MVIMISSGMIFMNLEFCTEFIFKYLKLITKLADAKENVSGNDHKDFANQEDQQCSPKFGVPAGNLRGHLLDQNVPNFNVAV